MKSGIITRVIFDLVRPIIIIIIIIIIIMCHHYESLEYILQEICLDTSGST